MKLLFALAFALAAFAITGYIDRLESERLSMSGYIKAKLEEK